MANNKQKEAGDILLLQKENIISKNLIKVWNVCRYFSLSGSTRQTNETAEQWVGRIKTIFVCEKKQIDLASSTISQVSIT